MKIIGFITLTFRDIINPVIIEEVKPIQLRITIQPGDTAVFKYDQDGNANSDDPDPNDGDLKTSASMMKNQDGNPNDGVIGDDTDDDQDTARRH